MTDHRLQLILLTLGMGLLAEPNSNVKTRIYLSAFKFISQNAHHVMNMEVPKIVLPNVTRNFSVGYGTGKVSVHGLNITEFQSPKFNFLPTNNGVSWSSEQGTIRLTGKWAAEYRMLVPMWTSGWVDILASGIRLNVSGRIVALDHHLQIVLGGCAAEVGSFHIEVGGGIIPWFVNIFRNITSRAFRNAVRDKACEISRSILLTGINDYLLSPPLHLRVWNNIYIDYAVERNPIFTRYIAGQLQQTSGNSVDKSWLHDDEMFCSSYIEAEAAAQVVHSNLSCHSPKIQEWTEVDLVPKMVVVWIGESVPNCLLSSAHEGELIEYTATKNMPLISSYLKTSCSLFSFSLCMGHFFPKLYTDYPNQHVDLHFHSYEAPFVQMKNNTIAFNSTFAIDFYIHPMKDHPKSLARLMLVSSFSLHPQIVENRLTANVTAIENHFRQDFSDIGIISNTFLFLFGKMFAMTTSAMIKSITKEGVPLPVFDNITISGCCVYEKHSNAVELSQQFRDSVGDLNGYVGTRGWYRYYVGSACRTSNDGVQILKYGASEIRIFEKYIRLNADLEFR